jgi:phosphocarrier protein
MELARSVRVTNRYGLHARTSTLLAQVANQFRSEVFLQREGSSEEVDAKSILGVMTLGAERGNTLLVRVRGDDAEAALRAITQLFEKNFNEE